MRSFLENINIPFSEKDKIFIYDHVLYSTTSIVDGEIIIPKKVRIAIESKIHRNQLLMDEQVSKYYNILCEKPEKRKVLLLISPDYEKPEIIDNIETKPNICSIIWIQWKKIYDWLKKRQNLSNMSSIGNYLVSEFLEYMELLNLVRIDTLELFESKNYDSKLKYILGNETVEKVLLHIFHFKKSYATKIARDFNMPLNGVQQQLRRLKKGGLLKIEKKGKTVIYSFNSRNPFIEEILGMLERVYKSIPPGKLNNLFSSKYRINK